VFDWILANGYYYLLRSVTGVTLMRSVSRRLADRTERARRRMTLGGLGGPRLGRCDPSWARCAKEGCAVPSAIDDKYASLNGARGFLGESVTDELTAPDGVGRYRHYHGGSIYWSPTTGAHQTHGLIRADWAAGWERGLLGHPTADENLTPDGAGRFNSFQLCRAPP
jgi:LGFP repeat